MLVDLSQAIMRPLHTDLPIAEDGTALVPSCNLHVRPWSEGICDWVEKARFLGIATAGDHESSISQGRHAWTEHIVASLADLARRFDHGVEIDLDELSVAMCTKGTLECVGIVGGVHHHAMRLRILWDDICRHRYEGEVNDRTP